VASSTFATALAEGFAATLMISLAASVLGVTLGLALAVVRDLRLPLLSQVAVVYVSLVRSTPVVALMLFVYFGFASQGLGMSPAAAAILALAINTSAFQSEIWRGELLALPAGQREAAQACGMTAATAYRRVVLPQVAARALPGLVNELTFLVKASPAAGVIGVVDLARVAVRQGSTTNEPLVPFLAATTIYVVFVMLMVALQRRIENTIARRMGAS
jgi:polar amino acid transport system permease protein